MEVWLDCGDGIRTLHRGCIGSHGVLRVQTSGIGKSQEGVKGRLAVGGPTYHKDKWGHSRYLNFPKWTKQQSEERIKKKLQRPLKDSSLGGIPTMTENRSVSICIESEAWKESVLFCVKEPSS